MEPRKCNTIARLKKRFPPLDATIMVPELATVNGPSLSNQ